MCVLIVPDFWQCLYPVNVEVVINVLKGRGAGCPEGVFTSNNISKGKGGQLELILMP